MNKQLDSRIEELREYVDKMRELIIPINSDLEKGILIPNAAQQSTIDHILSQGQQALNEFERLKKIKKSLL